MSLAIAAACSTRTVIAVGLIGLESGSTFTRSGGCDVADTGRCPGFDTARTAALLCTHGCNTGACAEPAGKLNSEEDLDALFWHRDFLARQRPDRTTSTMSDPSGLLRAPEGS